MMEFADCRAAPATIGRQPNTAKQPDRGKHRSFPGFSADCSHVRSQGLNACFAYRQQPEQVSFWLVAKAGGRTQRRRFNKLSCAGWLPHYRSFVSGLPRSKDERRSGS